MNPDNVWKKVEKDQVLNVSELAIVTGYGRSTLNEMKLPLIHGKIPLSDFKRILRRRQDALETTQQPSPPRRQRTLPIENASSPPAHSLADNFFAPKATIKGSLTRRGR